MSWRNPHLWYITVMMIVLAVFYYLPSLNMPHDLHRSLFSIPVLYAAYRFRIKGVIAIASISMLIFLYRALFVSPYPYALLRAIIFVIGLWFSGFFFATALNTIAKRKQAEGSIDANLVCRLGANTMVILTLSSNTISQEVLKSIAEEIFSMLETQLN